MTVIVRVIMVVRMAMAVMTMLVTARMVMLMIIIVMMQPLARTRTTRVFVEHQRLDGHWDCIGRHANATQIDVVEIPQHHTVDD
jgi:hypothetical protein